MTTSDPSQLNTDQQALLDLVADVLPSTVWTASADGKITYISSDISYKTGEPAAAFLGDDWVRAIHPEDLPETEDLWRACVQNGTPFDTRYRILSVSTGDYEWHEIHARAQRDASGTIIRWVGTSTNVHARITAEARLAFEREIAELETRILAKISKDDALDEILDEITQLVDRMVAGARASIHLVDGNRLVHGSAPSLPRHFSQAVSNIGIREGAGSCGTAAYRREAVVVTDIRTDPLWSDYRHLAENTPLRACWAVPVLNNNNECIATFAVYFDAPRAPTDAELKLTDRIARFVRLAIERSQQHDVLRLHEERLKIITQGSHDIVWDWDLENDSLWWSDGIKTQFGYEPAALGANPRNWLDLIHPQDLEQLESSVQQAFEGTIDHWQGEYRMRHSDGKYRHVLDRGRIMRDDTGKAIRAIGSLIDVSERREMEERLQQSQRLDSIGKLTGGIAHDFNNLLTVILGNSELLAMELESDPSLRAMAEITQSAAMRGAELTNRLLAFARRQPLDPSVTDINQLISNFEPLLRRTLGENIEIEVVQRAGLWRAMIDAGQLENAILNLAINARDAMPHGGRLTIETANVAVDDHYADMHDIRPGQYIQLAVSDTGTGMTAETVARAFEPFFTTKGVGKGSGLGLAMVYGFVRQSNGQARIYSELGHGTTVKLYLPRSYEIVDEHETESTAPITSNNQEKILLVEDNDLVRAHVESLMKSLGYRVLSASNGADALQILENDHSIDMLLTDVVMPGGISGKVLADRAQTLRPGLPILFTSGYTENAIVHHGRLDPDVQLLQKPFRRQELAGKIHRVLSGGRK